MRRRFTDIRNPFAWGVLLAGYWLTLVVMTHIPLSESLSPATDHDKTLHFAAFFVLAAILAVTWHLARGPLSRRQLAGLWLICVLYGALDEWTQGFVGRTASVWDCAADAAGAALGIGAFVGLRHWYRRRRRGAPTAR